MGAAPEKCHGTAESCDSVFPGDIQEHYRELVVLVQQQIGYLSLDLCFYLSTAYYLQINRGLLRSVPHGQKIVNSSFSEKLHSFREQ